MALSDSQLSDIARTIRVLSAEAVDKAKSGHPGMPMGAADYAAVIWGNYLRANPKDPEWVNRDRFVLSAGHGSMLLYSLLHLFGYELSMDQIKSFRQWGSITPGHPEFGVTPGVETTTGPLGQGVGNGIGLALSGKMMQARYGAENFNYRVFGIVSDGDLMEGVAAEAASLAGHLKLDNIYYFYDDNEISIGGSTDITFTENVPARFASYGWDVVEVDGHNIGVIRQALDGALTRSGKPHLIVCRTTIGKGSPNKAGKSSVHGEPLGADELKLTKEALGWTEGSFVVPKSVGEACCAALGEKVKVYEAWQQSAKSLADNKNFQAQISRSVPAALRTDLIAQFKDGKPDATRNLSGAAIQTIAKYVPGFVGGSADLEPSTKTLIKDGGDVTPMNFAAKNLRFGVREHGMGAIANGLAYTRVWVPYTATFLVFSDYMRPTIRLAALSHLQTLFIFTHDSFFVGEDGPTHQPIEHIQALRMIPNLHVFRPADGIETAASYLAALELKKSPSALLFTRQNLPPLEGSRSASFDDILKGGYVVHDTPGADTAIVATGSEVWVAIEVAKSLNSKGRRVRVVSLPCVELFKSQSDAYREKVLPATFKKVSLEAGITMGWRDVVGAGGLCLGIDHYGASAPADRLADEFGFTPKKVEAKISAWLA